jgi:23S rRNA pseudouridine1911/1915/1917 synthase
MMVCPEGGNAREAVTFYKTAETFGNYAFVNLHPETGRTHQLRIHMQHIACPIVADRMYIGQAALLKSEVLNSFVRESSGKIGQPKQRLHSGNEEAHDFTSDGDVLIGRQALHAFRLTIKHPQSGKEMQFEAPLPDDFERTLAFLRSLRSSG